MPLYFPSVGGGSGGDVTAAQGAAGTQAWLFNLTEVGSAPFGLGQSTKAGSLPVTLASDQGSLAVSVSNFPATQPVSGTVTVQQSTAANLLAQVSNNGTFPVQATLSAETTKVIGTVNQGTSPWVVGQSTYASLLGQMKVTDGTNFLPTMDIAARAGFQKLTDGTNSVTLNSTTYTSKFGLDVNLLGTLGTAFSTAGAVNVQGISAGTPINVAPQASTTGGYTPYFANAIKTGTSLAAVQVSSAAGKLAGLALLNTDAVPAFLQCYDTTSAVTVGTTTPTFVIPYLCNATAGNGAVDRIYFGDVGIGLANGFKVAATTTATSSTASANGLTGSIFFK